MKNKFINKLFLLLIASIVFASCGKDFLELEPRGTQLESSFYQTQEELFQGLVATYDVLQWGGTNGWTMKVGLLNAASDDCFAGGSDASDQPSWVAFDGFTLDPFLGPQSGVWNKYYSGIYRANLFLEKVFTFDVLMIPMPFWSKWHSLTQNDQNVGKCSNIYKIDSNFFHNLFFS